MFGRHRGARTIGYTWARRYTRTSCLVLTGFLAPRYLRLLVCLFVCLFVCCSLEHIRSKDPRWTITGDGLWPFVLDQEVAGRMAEHAALVLGQWRASGWSVIGDLGEELRGVVQCWATQCGQG